MATAIVAMIAVWRTMFSRLLGLVKPAVPQGDGEEEEQRDEADVDQVLAPIDAEASLIKRPGQHDAVPPRS